MSNENQVNVDELLKAATAEANKWIEAWKPVGKRDSAKVQEILEQRTFEGDRCIVRVVNSREEVIDAVKDCAKEVLREMGEDDSDENVRKHCSGAYACLWDYYLMAFYESAMKAANLSHPFTDQSLLPAFQAGLGWLVNMGNLLVGVMLPEEIYKDEDNRLHHPTNYAIKWGDEEQYWWRGVRVEGEWIKNPEGIDPAEALRLENAEQRRACCEIVGWEKILDKLQAAVVDKDENPYIGTLLKADLPDAPGSQFLKVLCGTGRTFALPVPEEMKTAIEAQAWMFQITEEEVREACKIRT